VVEVLADQRRLLQADRLTSTRTLTALLVGGALTVAGCGGGAGNGPGDTLAKSELAAKADSICKKASNDLGDLPPLTDLHDPKQVEAYFGAAKPIAERQNAALKALRPAADVKADYSAFVAQTDRATRLLSSTYEAAKAKDAARGRALLRRLSTTISATDLAAARLGMTACGGS
jgi:hypothetical protein